MLKGYVYLTCRLSQFSDQVEHPSLLFKIAAFRLLTLAKGTLQQTPSSQSLCTKLELSMNRGIERARDAVMNLLQVGMPPSYAGEEYSSSNIASVGSPQQPNRSSESCYIEHDTTKVIKLSGLHSRNRHIVLHGLFLDLLARCFNEPEQLAD